ncbi:type I restriction-modification system subunit M [Spirochaetia bacterium]|nr:type I restriction-modification system subunit M [Spirochaetia bacterium]
MEQTNNIEQAILKAGNLLAGTVGIGAVRDYLLPLFFVKYIEENSFSALFAQRNDPGLGERINKTFAAIEADNAQTLSGVLTVADYSNTVLFGGQEQRDRVLKGVLEYIAPLDLHQQELGKTFDRILERLAGISGSGKYGPCYTRPFVSDLISSLAAPREGETIYDPACGSASLLIKTAKKAKGYSAGLYGQDIDISTAAVAKMNVLINGFTRATITQGDTFANPAFTAAGNKLKQFDIVISDIPLNKRNWKAGLRPDEDPHVKLENSTDPFHRFKYGVPSASWSSWAFLQHMLASCNGHGRVIATAPAGALFRISSERDIRCNIIEENLLDAVLALPKNSFLETAVSGCILVFKKKRKERDVFFIDTEKMGVDEIVAAHIKRTNVENYARRISIDEIRNNDYNLSLNRYINSAEDGKTGPRDIQKINELIGHIKDEIEILDTEMKRCFKEIDNGK